MKIVWVVLCMVCSQAALSAETSEVAAADRDAQRERLKHARQQLEDQYKSELKQCYQYFDVTGCRLKARERRIEANALLRQEELVFNAQERQIKADDARRDLAERNSEAERKNSEAQRAQALSASKERTNANAQKQIDHALQGTKRGDYEQRQRDATQHREEVAKKQRERTKEPAAPLPAPAQ